MTSYRTSTDWSIKHPKHHVDGKKDVDEAINFMSFHWGWQILSSLGGIKDGEMNFIWWCLTSICKQFAIWLSLPFTFCMVRRSWRWKVLGSLKSRMLWQLQLYNAIKIPLNSNYLNTIYVLLNSQMTWSQHCWLRWYTRVYETIGMALKMPILSG